MFTLGARHVPAVELALLSMSELVLAPLWVWLAVGEVPSAFTLAGGAIVMTAIALPGALGRPAPPRHRRWCERRRERRRQSLAPAWNWTGCAVV